MRNTLAQKQFLAWLKSYDLGAYNTLMAAAEEEGLSAADGTTGSGGGFWGNIASTFNKILPTITSSVAQAKIFKAQMGRAKRGLPPLKTAEYAPTMRIQADVGSGIKQLAIPMMVAAGALVLFFILKKK